MVVAKVYIFVTNTANSCNKVMNADELYMDENEQEEDGEVFDPDDYDLDEED